MKGLLHSKLFRKNLCKWFFMYIAVIGIFTSVVTYSKYISSMQSNADKTKVAKFDASITYDRICTEIEENQICDIGSYRPTSNISYYFTVDTTNLEVSTMFITRITILDVFKNIKIYDVTENEIEMTNFTNNGNVYTLIEDINLGQNYIRKYKVTMDFNSGAALDNDYSSEHNINGAVIVGYSATQKD